MSIKFQGMIDYETMRHIKNFAKELKEGIRGLKISDFGEGLANILCEYIDKKVELYEDYFDVFARELEEKK